MKFYRPLPINQEIKIDSRTFIVSKTDYRGNIIYSNEAFSKITGYTQSEIMGLSHNIVRHPDMPKAIFFLMWKRLKEGQNIQALVKNLAKSGKYYWVSTDFEIYQDTPDSKPTYIAYRRSVSENAIEEIEPLYVTLLELEKAHGLEASLLFLQGFLDERHLTFDEYMSNLLKPKGLIAIIFNKMKSTLLHAA